MSQAEELLNSLSEEVPVHSHPVPDTDTYFIIDPITRTIENTNRKKTVIMQYDHNSERFTFELPRYVDGHDMLECTSVTVNVDNIEVAESDGVEVVEPRVNSDAPDMTDLRLHPDNSEKVISSWLISRNSTQLAGKLSFSIEYKCVDSNGTVVYEWSTDAYNDIEVRARKKNGEAAVIEHTDLLEQWRAQIFGAGDSVMANIAAEGKTQVDAVKAESESQQEAVELKGAQTLDSIPEDYTEVDAMADEAVRSKGDAIVCEAAGESIIIKDSSDDHIRGLKLFGKSSQVTTTGKNLFNHLESNFPKTMGGVTFTYNDGVICLNGTCDSSFNLKTGTVELIDGIYTLSANNPAHNGNDLALVQVYNYDTGLAITAMDKSVNTHVSGALTAGTYECRIRVQNGVVYNNFKISPQLELGEIATSYEPYTGGKPSPSPDYPQDIVSIENPTIDLFGKNLAHPVGNARVVNGYTLTPNADGTMTVSGAAIAAVDTVIDLALIMATSTYEVTRLKPNVHYTLTCWKNGQITETPGTKQILADGSIKWGWTSVEDQERVITKLYRQFVPEIGDTDVCGTYAIQIEVGTEHTEYTPYVNQQLVVTHTIPGVPVTSGGNHTDTNGQQWVCDEVDLERGVYIQRVMKYTAPEQIADDLDRQTNYDGNGYYGWVIHDDRIAACGNTRNDNPGYSTHFVVTNYSDPRGVNQFRIWGAVSCLYFTLNTDDAEEAANVIKSAAFYLALETPIETPLTAEEITAFKSLRTNYPNTTILNDAGAWMSVKYNADTKAYVDNPKVLKLVDSSTGVVYELKVINGNLTVTPIE